MTKADEILYGDWQPDTYRPPGDCECGHPESVHFMGPKAKAPTFCTVWSPHKCGCVRYKDKTREKGSQ